MKEQNKIKDRDLWNQFFASGKIEDYLSYASGGRSTEQVESVKAEWAGDDSHAGVYRGNRNHIETDAYR